MTIQIIVVQFYNDYISDKRSSIHLLFSFSIDFEKYPDEKEANLKKKFIVFDSS